MLLLWPRGTVGAAWVRRRARPTLRVAALPLALALGGCASTSSDHLLTQARQQAAPLLPAAAVVVAAAPDPAAQASPPGLTERLAQPLSMDDAVVLSFARDPDWQARLAAHLARAARIEHGARPASPVFTLERLSGGGELELARSLSVGLVDLLRWPSRRRLADLQHDEQATALAADVVDQAVAVRNAWIDAVAARESLQAARQRSHSAALAAELARRLQAAGHWSPSDQARQALMASEAARALDEAEQAALERHEALARHLGLGDDEVPQLRLPERLPTLPASLPDASALQQVAPEWRLDIRQARAALDQALEDAGWINAPGWSDVELTARMNTVFGADGHATRQRGAEIGMALPIFGGTDAGRQQRQAQVASAWWQWDAARRQAGSQLRTAQAAWRSQWRIARRYADEVLPARQTLSQQTLLRYNGMQIGVMELLADAGEQADTQRAAIAAAAQFWRTDTALQASLVGLSRPAVPARAPDTPATPATHSVH